MDEAALQAMLQQHPGRVAWEVQAGSRSKEWENGQQALRHRVEKRTGKTLKLRSFEPELSIIGSRVEEKSKEGKAFHPEEKVAWRKCGNGC